MDSKRIQKIFWIRPGLKTDSKKFLNPRIWIRFESGFESKLESGFKSNSKILNPRIWIRLKSGFKFGFKSGFFQLSYFWDSYFWASYFWVENQFQLSYFWVIFETVIFERVIFELKISFSWVIFETVIFEQFFQIKRFFFCNCLYSNISVILCTHYIHIEWKMRHRYRWLPQLVKRESLCWTYIGHILYTCIV